MKLIVGSVCHNEDQRLHLVLSHIPKKIPGIDEIEVVVIDDGSTDNTVKVARENGARVIQLGQRTRLPYAFIQAVDYFLSNEADIAVNIDGDFQFNPEEIPQLIEPIIKGDADFVAADRFTTKDGKGKKRPEGMPLSKYLGNLLGSWVLGKLSGQKFTDVTCGFRAYNRKALLSLNLNSKGTYTQESFQVLAMKKLRIKNIPVSIKYYSDKKGGSRVVEKGVLNFMFNSAFNILKAFRDFSPMKFFGGLGLTGVLPGFILMVFVGIHFLLTGSFSPYRFIGLLGLYIFTIGILAWIVGLLADMFNRVTNNQEKILYYTKSMYYDRKKEK